jgi:hypothetical protein
MNRADKDPRALAVLKSIRLRARARNLKGQAEDLLKKADILLAEAELVEAGESQRKKLPEDLNQAASRIVRGATSRL